MHDVGTGTGIAAVQRQLRGVGVIRQAGVMVCVSSQLQGKGTVFAGLHRDGQVCHTALDAVQRSFALHRHIFMEGALAVDCIQFTHRGLKNASVLDMQLARTDGLPEPLAALGLILGVRPGLQPCGHDAAAIRGKGGLGGVEVDAAIHSWDQFPDFETRGKLFKNTILKYKNGLFIEKGKHIYMIGIGGVSMSGIADILINMGYKVSGSDRVNSVITDKLKENGIQVYVPQSKNNITDDIDFLVYTAAIKEDNVEMIEAKKKKIPMMERGEFLGEITKLYSNTIGIAGTHGKTSTTSMVSLIFLEAGRDPTIQVGSILSNINGNYRVGKSDTLIIEACEYCDSFLSFKQKSAIILNIDNDHLDYFKNLENIKKSFNKYVSHLPNDGYLVINNDDKNSSELKDNTSAKVVTYGINNDSDYMATDIDYDAEGCARFNVINYGNNLGRIELSVPGEHNVLNALSAIALASSYDISFEDIKKGIKKYKGASRRLEYKGKFKGACVYDDYGHHPTEIMATSNAIHKKQYNESWVIFEAHTYSRAYKHKVDFAKALKNFDHIIVTDIYAAREENVYGITEDDIVKAIKKYGKEAFYISNYDDIKLYLSQYVHDGDLILTLGAGNVTKVADLLVSKNE